MDNKTHRINILRRYISGELDCMQRVMNEDKIEDYETLCGKVKDMRDILENYREHIRQLEAYRYKREERRRDGEFS